MSKMRVYELAKQLNVSSKQIIELLREFNYNIKNHMSTVDDDAIKLANKHFKDKDDSEAAETEDDTKKGEKTEEKKTKNIDGAKGSKPMAKPSRQNRNTKPVEEKPAPQASRTDKGNANRIIYIGSGIAVKDFAGKLGKPSSDVIKRLIIMGVMASINHEIDFETCKKVAEQYGITVEAEPKKESNAQKTDDIQKLLNGEDKDENLKPRPPVVTVMGHVDHGKTSLLDVIRKTHVTEHEAGGITQHIGAYTVDINGSKITFIDTPGHEAFTAMRARGAQATDIAVLVVAADDGVMPQTVEAINHARAAKVPIIVAINKMDKPGANPDKVKQGLTEYGLIPEDWGGDTICVPVSAKTKMGIDSLLEMILLVAEMRELKANPNRFASGIVIESKLDKGRGPVATILVKNGTLKIGDHVIAGTIFGKVRAMFNDKGKPIKKAAPSIPVEVLGFNDVPEAGDIINAVADEKTARQIAEKRIAANRNSMNTETRKMSLEGLFEQLESGKVKELNIIVKADVQGSVEAVTQSLQKLSNEKVKVNVIHGGVGAITEADVILASVSNAVIIGFNVRPDTKSRVLAENEKVDIRTYRIIYEAIDDIEAAMKGMLEPEYREVVQGRAEVRTTFKVSSVGTIAGCYVTEGRINRSNDIRVIRNGIVINEGKIASLKRFKDDVREVTSGYECGINIDKFNDVKEGDILEAYANEKVEYADK